MSAEFVWIVGICCTVSGFVLGVVYGIWAAGDLQDKVYQSTLDANMVELERSIEQFAAGLRGKEDHGAKRP